MEWLLAFAVLVLAWWVVAAVADTRTGEWIAARAGAAADRIRQERAGPPPLPPPPPVPPVVRLWIDMQAGTAEDIAGRDH